MLMRSLAVWLDLLDATGVGAERLADPVGRGFPRRRPWRQRRTVPGDRGYRRHRLAKAMRVAATSPRPRPALRSPGLVVAHRGPGRRSGNPGRPDGDGRSGCREPAGTAPGQPRRVP